MNVKMLELLDNLIEQTKQNRLDWRAVKGTYGNYELVINYKYSIYLGSDEYYDNL